MDSDPKARKGYILVANEQMSSATKHILLNALKEYKDTEGKDWTWGQEDADAINEAEEWLYAQVMPEDKDALQERFWKIEKQLAVLKAEIDWRDDKRFELILEIGDVRRMMEEADGDN